MRGVFTYVIGLGAAVMMPVIFTVLGVCDGFCFWTIVDVVVKQFDAYTSQGFLDPFWRPKRGGWTPEEFAKFNSPTCVLADFQPDRRVFAAGERFRCRQREEAIEGGHSDALRVLSHKGDDRAR